MAKRINFSDHVNSVFSDMGTTYEGMKNLMVDLYKGKEIYDAESGRVVSKAEAEDTLREMSRKIFGITEDSSKRDRKRAYRDHGREYFDVIEEVIDITLTTGLQENEWFNSLVNYKNLALGDDISFYNEGDEVILAIAKMGMRHHDTILQRLGKGKSYRIETELYGAAVGADIDRYLMGQEDWSKLVAAITRAFAIQIQDTIFNAVMGAAAKIPAQAQFVGTGALTTGTKAAFDEIIENVAIANNISTANLTILGTYTALTNLENLINVQWLSNDQKDSKDKMGRLGNYGPVTLVEIPQRFQRNDVTKKVYNNKKLWIIANGDYKLVDFVDVGETVIDEITDRGEATGRLDDTMKYEVQREFGAAVRFGKYFGEWTLA